VFLKPGTLDPETTVLGTLLGVRFDFAPSLRDLGLDKALSITDLFMTFGVIPKGSEAKNIPLYLEDCT
jgi:hypothetical protein